MYIGEKTGKGKRHKGFHLGVYRICINLFMFFSGCSDSFQIPVTFLGK